MAKQTEKQRRVAASNANTVRWQGQICEVIGDETVIASDGRQVQCVKLKVIGLPLHQGLRLVPKTDLESTHPTEGRQ